MIDGKNDGFLLYFSLNQSIKSKKMWAVCEGKSSESLRIPGKKSIESTDIPISISNPIPLHIKHHLNLIDSFNAHFWVEGMTQIPSEIPR